MWKKLLPVFTLCGAAAIAADYNVLEHGLKADGRSDNTAAMAALPAKTAPGDTSHFPGGTYFFTGDIKLDGTGLTLDGSGTILFEHKDDDPAWNDNRKINITGKKIAVRNLKVTSTAKTRSAVYGLVSCFDADDVRIENLEIYNSPSTAIYTIHSSRIWILNNFVHDQWADGIHVSRGSDQVLIHGNVIERNGDDGIGVVSYHGPEPWNRHPRNNRIIMTDNIISRTPARGICASGGNLTICGNIISQTGKAGIICTAEGWISAYTLIEGNTVFDVGTAEKYGFDFYDTRGTRSGIHVQYNRDMMILNNMIYNARQGGRHLGDLVAGCDGFRQPDHELRARHPGRYPGRFRDGGEIQSGVAQGDVRRQELSGGRGYPRLRQPDGQRQHGARLHDGRHLGFRPERSSQHECGGQRQHSRRQQPGETAECPRRVERVLHQPDHERQYLAGRRRGSALPGAGERRVYRKRGPLRKEVEHGASAFDQRHHAQPRAEQLCRQQLPVPDGRRGVAGRT